MQPQDVVPSTPATNVEIQLIAHSTQGQTSSKLTDTESRRDPILRCSYTPCMEKQGYHLPRPPLRHSCRSLLSCKAGRPTNLHSSTGHRPWPSHQLIKGRRPNIMINCHPLGRVDQADHTTAQGAQQCQSCRVLDLISKQNIIKTRNHIYIVFLICLTKAY
jgi:hypothetical protein